MFEGNNIHFSPLDNKPLCSYSSKLCRQRRLNGYAFCIRHILEDKSAPFKQCGYVTRNNYQKCLNAIPSNQERGYCHSHMQVAGLTPKTERKPKVTNNSASGVSGGKSNNSSINNNNSGSGSTNSSTTSSILPPASLSQSQNAKNSNSGTSAGQGGNGKIKSENIGIKKEVTSFPNTTKSSLNTNNNNLNHLSLSSSSVSKVTPSHKGKSYLAASNLSSTNTGLKTSLSNATSLICGKNNSKINGNLTNNLNEPPTKSNTNGSNNNSNNNKKPSSNTNANQISTESQSSLSTPASAPVKKEPPKKPGNSSSKLGSAECVPVTQNQSSNENLKKKIQLASNQNTNAKSGNGNSGTGADKAALNSSNKSNVNHSSNNAENKSSPTTTTAPAPANPSSPASDRNLVSTLCVRDRWMSFKFLPQDSEDLDIKPARQLEQMKTIKILEKLPLFAEVCSNNSTNINSKSDVKKVENGNRNNSKNSNTGANANGLTSSNTYSVSNIPISSGIEILLGPPFLSKTKLFSVNKSNKASLAKSENGWRKINDCDDLGGAENVDGKSCEIQIQIPKSNNKRLKVQLLDDTENKKNREDSVDDPAHDFLHPWEWESRKQFLKRVRTAFKRQYKTIRKACKLSEEQDKSEKGFRDALLTCAMSDSSLCAQILSTGDSKLDEICSVLLTSRKVAPEIQNPNANTLPADQSNRLSSASRSTIKIQSKARSNGNVSNPNLHSHNNNANKGKNSSVKMSETSRTNNNNGMISLDMKATTLNGDLSLCEDNKSCIGLTLSDSKDNFHNELAIGGGKSGNQNNNFKLNSGGNCMWNNMNAEPKKLKVNKKPNLKTSALSNGTHSSGNKASGSVNSAKTGGNGSGSGGSVGVSGPKKKAKKTKALSSPTSLSSTMKRNVKKRKVESVSKVDVNVVSVSDLEFNGESSNGQLNATNSSNTIVLHSDDSHSQNQNNHNHSHLLQDTLNLNSHQQLLAVSSSVDLQAVANLETVLNSVSSSSDAATTPEGVITDASFDSPFDHSTSSHPDCEFSDDDLEKSFELQIDPEIAHQASRLLEDNGLTEDDFNELFPETRMGDHKLIGRADLTDLGIDFTSNFDANDIDYSLFANIFPNFRSSQPESISVNNQF